MSAVTTGIGVGPLVRRAAVRRAKWGRRLPLLPALLFVIALTQLPFVLTLWFSLHHWNLLAMSPPRFIGLRNYVFAFGDSTFLGTILHTLVMTVSIVFCALVAGGLMALGLNRPFPGRAVIRTLAVTPFFIMPVAAALFWKTALYNPTFGLFGALTASLGLGRIDWLSAHPVLSVVLISAWQWSAFVLMIILAGLQSFPEEVEEAAAVDGASRLHILWRLVLPHLRPFLELSGLLVAMYVLENVAVISLLTGGGPAYATTNLSYYVYLQAFSAFDMGRASAYGMIALIIAIALVTPLLRVVAGILREEGRR
ncbi:MAG TPA: sugar ABC transporter permease [Rhodopila sp.]|nr:sugar ABC transporter permease [Rhodopila sp.]